MPCHVVQLLARKVTWVQLDCKMRSLNGFHCQNRIQSGRNWAIWWGWGNQGTKKVLEPARCAIFRLFLTRHVRWIWIRLFIDGKLQDKYALNSMRLNEWFLGVTTKQALGRRLDIAVLCTAVSIKNEQLMCQSFSPTTSLTLLKNDSWKFKRQSWKLWQRQFWHNRRRKQRRKYTTLLHVTRNRDRRLTSSSQMFSSVGVHSTRDFISWD